MAIVDEILATIKEVVFGKGIPEAVGIALAAVIMYLVALWVVRSGKKRFFGRNTVFDLILAFMLGSVLSRAINGDAPVVATAIAAMLLIALHWLMGTIAMRSRRFGRVVKGAGDQVIRDGEMLHDAMAEHHVTRNDILEAARSDGLSGIDEIQDAYFERSGRVSIVPKPKVRIIDIDVAQGVQTVRVEVMH